MKIFDIHSDLLTDIAWRRSRGEVDVFDRIHYPRLKKVGVSAMICVIWVEPAFRNQPLARFQEVFHFAMEDLNASKHAHICLTVEDMAEPSDEKVNLFLGVEGMTFVQEWKGNYLKDKVDNAFNTLHQKGFRHAIFVWNEWNALASGTGTDSAPPKKGLQEGGEIAIKKATELNWLLDVSHLDEPSFWDIYHRTEQPLIASHSNAYTICPHERNLKDEQIKAIAKRGGLIGLNAYPTFIDIEYPSIDRLVDHAVYMADLVGHEYIAFGFDFVDYLASYDLGASFSSQETIGFENVTKIPDLIETMRKKGFTEEEIEAISFNNAFEFIKNHLRS